MPWAPAGGATAWHTSRVHTQRTSENDERSWSMATWKQSRCVALSALILSSLLFGSASVGLKHRSVRASSTMPKNEYLRPTTLNASCGTAGRDMARRMSRPEG